MKTKFIMVIFMSLFFLTPLFAEQKQLTLATLEWKPYVGSDMPNYGFTAEIVTEAFKKAGYQVNIEFHPWTKSLKSAKEGKVDGVFPAYFSEKRSEFFAYSQPFASSALGLCKIRTFSVLPGTGGGGYKTGYAISYSVDPRIDQTEALRALKQYKFGVVSGYVNTAAFDAADFLTKVDAPTDEALLNLLFQDEVQLIVIDRHVMENTVENKFPWRRDEVEFLEPPLAERRLYLAFSKNAENFQKKRKDFNRGLNLIKEDLLLKRIMEKYGF